MLFNIRKYFWPLAMAMLLMTGIVSVTHAEEDDDERMPMVKNAQWQAECGSCHVAFPPRLLPAASWRAVMAGLDKHFGTNASLDPKVAKEIGVFLEKNAGSSRYASSSSPILRITETRWFKQEHDEVSARTWNNPKVKSAVNCVACHTGAERGDFSEHGIRIPK